MIAVAAFGVVVALALRLAGDLVRDLILAGIWALPVLPILAAWSLLADLARHVGLAGAGHELGALIFSAFIVGGAVLAAFVQLWRRPMPARLALISTGLVFGLIDLGITLVDYVVS